MQLLLKQTTRRKPSNSFTSKTPVRARTPSRGTCNTILRITFVRLNINASGAFTILNGPNNVFTGATVVEYPPSLKSAPQANKPRDRRAVVPLPERSRFFLLVCQKANLQRKAVEVSLVPKFFWTAVPPFTLCLFTLCLGTPPSSSQLSFTLQATKRSPYFTDTSTTRSPTRFATTQRYIGPVKRTRPAAVHDMATPPPSLRGDEFPVPVPRVGSHMPRFRAVSCRSDVNSSKPRVAASPFGLHIICRRSCYPCSIYKRRTVKNALPPLSITVINIRTSLYNSRDMSNPSNLASIHSSRNSTAAVSST